MSWDAISTIAEVIGAAAVVGTLIYLAIQIRQGNDNDRVQGIQQLGRDYAAHTAAVTRDEMVGSFMKGLNRYGDLTPEERAKFEYCVGGYINLGEAALYHAEVNRLHEAMEMLSAYLGPRVFAYPGFREWWRHGDRAGFAESTQDWVDEQIARNADTPLFWEYGRGEPA
jgi:hypothetical protein